MTKTFAIALAAVLGSVTLASADVSYFSLDRVHSDNARVELGVVRSATDGVIELYDYNNDVVGELLGTTTVHAGANSDVAVIAGPRLINDVYAVLKSNSGEILADNEIDGDRF
jgi:hypothetical protein